jgi:hypothetical protein
MLGKIVGAIGKVATGATGFVGGAIKGVTGIAGNVLGGVQKAVGNLIGSGVGAILGPKAGSFVNNIFNFGPKLLTSVVGGLGKAAGGIVNGVVGGIGKCVKFIGGTVLGGIVKGVGGIVKGIGGFIGGLFGSGRRKKLRIARRTVEDVRSRIEAQLRILEEQVHTPMQQMVTATQGGSTWIGKGADAFTQEVSSLYVPGAGRIQDSLRVSMNSLIRAVATVDAADRRASGHVINLSEMCRAVGAF